MRPEAALETQLARYRAMSREERVGIALRLHELACEMSRLGIRRQHPKASAAEVEQQLRQRLEFAWFGETLWLATAEDVILPKLYWNRITPSDRQLGDVAGVVHVQRGKLDEPYLRHWAAELNVSAELEAALSGSLKPKRT